jgi:hypothetical protein
VNVIDGGRFAAGAAFCTSPPQFARYIAPPNAIATKGNEVWGRAIQLSDATY